MNRQMAAPHASCSFVTELTMCLGIPGKVTETYREHDVLMGKVDFGGVFKRVCLQHTSEVQPGQYVIVHVGFALQIIDEHEAQQVFAFLQRMNELQELQAGEGSTEHADRAGRQAEEPNPCERDTVWP
jgi:hydrogenase expression/formation protein HypC